MSQGTSCKCVESKRPINERRWMVVQRHSRCSAFDGYRHMYSPYSCIHCLNPACRATWRTKADFVNDLPDGDFRDGDFKFLPGQLRLAGTCELCKTAEATRFMDGYLLCQPCRDVRVLDKSALP